LMAEIERVEHNDEGRAREWLARAVNAAPDPAWTADGHVSDRWLPLSPSGKLDGYKWRVPLTGIAELAPKIESSTAPSAPALTAAPAVMTRGPAQQNLAAAPDKPTLENVEPSSAASEAINGPALRRVTPQPKAEPVIPLVHAPDDPGPEATEESEPHTEPQTGGGWRKIFE
jgi:HemY protein